MTSTLDDIHQPPSVVVFGLDDSGKPHASLFVGSDTALATKAASLMGMKLLCVTTEPQQLIAEKLPKGKIFASGKGFVPFVKASLFAELVAVAPEEKLIAPSQHAKLEKITKQHSGAQTFKVIADEFIAKVAKEGKAETTKAKKEWLLGLAMKDLGSRPISEITAAEVLVPLRKVEDKGNYETARRMRAAIGQVFRFAIATARAENDPTFGLRGALTAPVVTHRAAFTDRRAFGGLLRAVWSYEGAIETRIALQLMAYLYPRPGELRHAEWKEFDVENAVWTIPATKTKMRANIESTLPKTFWSGSRSLGS